MGTCAARRIQRGVVLDEVVDVLLVEDETVLVPVVVDVLEVETANWFDAHRPGVCRCVTWRGRRRRCSSPRYAVGRSISPQWGAIRCRLALRTYDAPPWGVRVVSLTKSRKIPTRQILPLFFVRQAGLKTLKGALHDCVMRSARSEQELEMEEKLARKGKLPRRPSDTTRAINPMTGKPEISTPSPLGQERRASGASSLSSLVSPMGGFGGDFENAMSPLRNEGRASQDPLPSVPGLCVYTRRLPLVPPPPQQRCNRAHLWGWPSVPGPRPRTSPVACRWRRS